MDNVAMKLGLQLSLQNGFPLLLAIYLVVGLLNQMMVLFVILTVLGIKPKASCVLGKYPITD